ncbi:MAG: hypothetical protein QY331_01720 [Melioribacteraceae bacterium]|nr:MAG: hypothetical protein QY331_01720 [Melioribacteraceae bacterium]
MKKKLTKKGLAVEKLLERDNKSVLTYIEDIKDDVEKEKTIKELIEYLDNCLLDRDIGKPGPKLIDQLKELQQKIENEVKEYRLEDLIWWKGSEGQLIYLYEQLVKNNFIDDSQEDRKYVLLANHFKNKKGNRFNNRQMGQAAQNLMLNKTQKPKDADKLIEIIKNIHQQE